jgi:hypothetical protein
MSAHCRYQAGTYIHAADAPITPSIPKEAYAKLPTKMIKKPCDVRRYAEDGAASEGFT